MGTKKFTVSQQRKNCIGCGSCAMYSPNCWKMNEIDGKADLTNGVVKGELVVAQLGVELLDENKKAAEACPMQIIKVNK